MHQDGHSRAHSMQEVQFSSSNAITPRLRGGSSGWTSGYCSVTDRRASVLAVTLSPSINPLPGTPTPPPPSVEPTSPCKQDTSRSRAVPVPTPRSDGFDPHAGRIRGQLGQVVLVAGENQAVGLGNRHQRGVNGR